MNHPGHCCVYGLGWGDEGKGKIVDLLGSAYDIVVRYNGGANAGHTVWIGTEKFALHLLPAGVLRRHMVAVIGPGVVVDPTALLEEITTLRQRGRLIDDQIRISGRAHLVMPWHKLEDQLSETSESNQKIGTTVRGIGPCYADKARRTSAIRFDDLIYDLRWADRVRRVVADKQRFFRDYYHHQADLDGDAVIAMLTAAREQLGPYVCDTGEYLRTVIAEGRKVLFEGANGLLLDIDHGTYPYVTSSSTGPAGVASGAGVPPTTLQRIIGVTKAYATRVGAGPFVTELTDEIGERIRIQGHEFGTTTGRPRRCGWFDAVACRYAVQVGGATELALMHLDTLAGFDEVAICVAYECDGRRLTTPPGDLARLERSRPVLERFPGWGAEVRDAKSRQTLPPTTRAYVERIEEHVGTKVAIISVGPERNQTLLNREWTDIVECCAGGPRSSASPD